MYEPTAFVVPGFPPAMPPMNQPPFSLTDQEILCVIAYLQTSRRHADGYAADETPLLRRRGRTRRGAGSCGAAASPAPGEAQPLAAPKKGEGGR